MKDFLARLKTIPLLILNVVNAFLDGIAKQVVTFKGSLFVGVISILILDILTKGSLGVISFSITTGNDIVTVFVNAVKGGGWPIIVLALIAVLWKRDSK